MEIDTFEARLLEASRGITALLQQAGATYGTLPEPLETALAHLHTLLEEIQVARVEMRQQNEHLLNTQELLDNERRRYLSLFQLAPDGYVVTDKEGLIQEINLAAAHLLGVPAHYLVGKPLATYVVLEDRRAFRNWLNHLKEPGPTQERDVRMLPRHQGPVLVTLTVLTTRDAHDTVSLRWMLRDISIHKRVEASQKRMAALQSTLAMLTSRPRLEPFLKEVLCTVADHLEGSQVTLWLYNQERNSFSAFLGCELDDSPDREEFPAGETEIPADRSEFYLELLRTRRPVVGRDAHYGPARPQQRRPELSPTLLVPLSLGEVLLGMFRIKRDLLPVFRPEEIEFALALAQQVTLEIHATRLAEQASHTALLQERSRMAQEIHDTLAQGFTSIMLQLEAADDLLAENPEKARAHIARARSLARANLAEARRSVWALRPQALQGNSLPDALRQVVADLAADSPAYVHFHVHGTPFVLPQDVEDNLLRIGQEALTNALRHAQAAKIVLDLTYAPHEARLSIRDNGRGFTQPTPLAGHGFGLVGMRERSERIGARLTIHSQPEQGTQVLVVTPCLDLPVAEFPLPLPPEPLR